MKKNYFKFLFFLILIINFLFIFSCVTNKTEDLSVNKSNYTTDDFIENKINQINQSEEESPIRSFWYSFLLYNEFKDNKKVHDVLTKTFTLCISYLDDLYEKQKWLEFCRDYDSIKKILNNCNDVSLQHLFDKNIYDERYFYANNNILSLFNNNLLPPNNSEPEKFSNIIDGTVTIWIDLGVKIEAGKAFSNKGIGSGFFIDSRGYLITNYHVISSQVDPEYEGISRLYIKLGDDTETRIPAKVVGYDKSLDLALLKTEIPVDYVFSLGSSSSLDVGDKIYAIGSPVGLERTLTSGIVSAEGRQLFSIATVMQIDAAVNNGNSGGPIVDEFGNVQAIVFAGMLEYEGLNFAIPVEYLKVLLPRLYYGGEVTHPFVGVYGKTAKDKGVEVLWLQNSSPAKYAGLKEGDIITAINGNKINSLKDLHLKQIPILSKSIIEYTIVDENNDEKNILVLSNERKDYPGYEFYKNESVPNYIYPLFGMKLKNVSSFFGNKYIVESVVSGSIADESGFSELDPVKIFRTYLSPEKDILFTELYSKKKSNGYLDVSLVLATPMDSESFF